MTEPKLEPVPKPRNIDNRPDRLGAEGLGGADAVAG